MMRIDKRVKIAKPVALSKLYEQWKKDPLVWVSYPALHAAVGRVVAINTPLIFGSMIRNGLIEDGDTHCRLTEKGALEVVMMEIEDE